MPHPMVILGLGLHLFAGLPAETKVTYNKDIAPILWKNCAGCHRPGEVGPFPLLTYEDAAKRAEFLQQVTESRLMPPWKAEPGVHSFFDERRLTDAEIKLIGDWAAGGKEQGKESDLPKAPKFPEGWQLGTPDLILELSEAFEVPASGADIFRNFVIPSGVTEDTNVSAVEFRPGNNKVVHHALFFLDTNGEGRKLDEASPGQGYPGFGGPGFLPTGALGGWAPGATPRPLPEAYARRLPKNSDLVVQIHYHPDGKKETDKSRIGIYFSKNKSARIVSGIVLRNGDINIPPGEAHYQRTATFTLPAPIRVVGISPHMHMVGKQMKVDAILPDGKTESLISIKDWDFNWQGQYMYQSPVILPTGTRLELEAYYDNSAANPTNPNSPPKVVRRGEQTTDEMCLCFLQIVPEKPGDAAVIRRAMMEQALQGAQGRGGAGGLLLERLRDQQKAKDQIKPRGIKP